MSNPHVTLMPLPVRQFRVEEPPPLLGALIDEWLLWNRAWWIDYRLQVALWTRRGVVFLHGDWLLWLHKESDTSDRIWCIKRWSDLEPFG